MDREVWSAAVHGVAKSWTRLSNWTELNMQYTKNPLKLLVIYLKLKFALCLCPLLFLIPLEIICGRLLSTFHVPGTTRYSSYIGHHSKNGWKQLLLTPFCIQDVEVFQNKQVNKQHSQDSNPLYHAAYLVYWKYFEIGEYSSVLLSQKFSLLLTPLLDTAKGIIENSGDIEIKRCHRVQGKVCICLSTFRMMVSCQETCCVSRDMKARV